jgi:hypothetical protein
MEPSSLKVGDQEVSVEEILKWKDTASKFENMEKGLNDKMQSLSEKEKELQPFVNLSKFMDQNPDKAEEIAAILEGKPKKAEASGDVEDPETIAKEARDAAKRAEEAANDVKENLEERDLKEVIAHKQEIIVEKYNEIAKEMPYLNKDVLFTKLLMVQGIDDLSDEKLRETIATVGKSVNDSIKEIVDKNSETYLEEKKRTAEKTKGEGAPKGSAPGKSGEQVTGINDGSAKRAAIKLMDSLKT